MRNFLFVSLLVILICVGDLMGNYYPSTGEQLVNAVLNKAATYIEKKYNLYCSGEGVAMPGGPIKEVCLCFDSAGALSKAKLRDLLIKCSNDVVDLVISNKEIQPFLAKTPFTVNDVQIIIYNNDKTGREVYEPLIATAQISQGCLTFRTLDPKDSFKFKNVYEETYTEALKLLN